MEEQYRKNLIWLEKHLSTTDFDQFNRIHGKLPVFVDRVNYTAQLKNALEDSVIDTLTRVYSRAHMERTAEIFFANEKRKFVNSQGEYQEGNQKQSSACEPLTLFMADIDHFKEFNTNHGHQGGDEVLRWYADMLQEGVDRSTDGIGRYGGEEFFGILPSTNLVNGVKVLEKIRSRIEQSHVPINNSENTINITSSFGIAQADFDTMESIEDLISAADLALYHAKENGRNQVAMYLGPNQYKTHQISVKK